MVPDLDKYETEDEFGPVTKLVRDVYTPLPDAEREENRKVCYLIRDEYAVAVSKVSHLGWTVMLYHLDEDAAPYEERIPRIESEQDAHSKAREMCEGVLA